MKTYDSICEMVREQNVKFIRLAFFDIFGTQKNIAIMPHELKRAFEEGIAIDGSAIAGFQDAARSDLFLEPDPETEAQIPWRSYDGGVIRMFCDITNPDGSIYERDSRYLLKQAVARAEEAGIRVHFGAEVEFYIFRLDEKGEATRIPHDNAGYFDIAPRDRGENLRRDICNFLLDMGIFPESSHHENGPGQHEVVFRYSDPLTTADNTSTLKWVVQSVALTENCYADFSPKPIPGQAGNGMHLNISVDRLEDAAEDSLVQGFRDDVELSNSFMAGILRYISAMTLFLNPVGASYDRLGKLQAPRYISWSEQNRSQLIRIPATRSGRRRFELRSPDPMANPYLAFALLIEAGLAGIREHMKLPEPVDEDLYLAGSAVTDQLEKLPETPYEAVQAAAESAWIREILPEGYLNVYADRCIGTEAGRYRR